MNLLLFGQEPKQQTRTAQGHLLYEKGDYGLPKAICDSNGDVVLGQCKLCNRAEIELDEECKPREPKVGDIWYRYDDRQVSVCLDPDGDVYGSETEVRRSEFWVVRVTPKGVWLVSKNWTKAPPSWEDCRSTVNHAGQQITIRHDLRLVLPSSRKRYASPTDGWARESFTKRKEKQASIHRALADRADKAISILNGGWPWRLRL